ncbi:5642_t:CDS:2 [Paraglomus brasilianum]|uniref:5642_t:CDS:1 n=1 Tax=Paraglomus brasilianum TaxID=144538 RepID=A0A9N9CP09_9GLOM|nr:5642_t:CDS:2 [Paraglomus brasilianum]
MSYSQYAHPGFMVTTESHNTGGPLTTLGDNIPHQLLSPAPSASFSSIDIRDSPISDELDVTEFYQYNKEKYESAKAGTRRRRKGGRDEGDTASSLDGDDGDESNRYALAYMQIFDKNACGIITWFRRRIHIQSEQKRRAEIKDGFEELRRQLPYGIHGRKMSKAVVLQKSGCLFPNDESREV